MGRVGGGDLCSKRGGTEKHVGAIKAMRLRMCSMRYNRRRV